MAGPLHDVASAAPPPLRGLALIPNAISIARLLVAFVFPLLPPDWRLPVLIAGAASDWVDGLIARLARARSLAGQILDPIADKAFTIIALLTLAFVGDVLWWQAALALARDVAVMVAAGYALSQRDFSAFRRMPPAIAGKITTVFLYLWLILVLAEGEWRPPPWTLQGAFIATAAGSVVTAALYMQRFAAALKARARAN